jgi:hypothetical protein
MKMQADVSQRMAELCEKIKSESDPGKFTQLLEELNRLIDEANARPKPPTNGSTISTAA